MLHEVELQSEGHEEDHTEGFHHSVIIIRQTNISERKRNLGTIVSIVQNHSN
jgi:hypothetical protein